MTPIDAVDARYSSALHELARAMGIATEYWSQSGEHVQVAERTLRAVITAMGGDPSTTESVDQSLREREIRAWRRVLPPTLVITEGDEHRLPVHVDHGASVRVAVECEDGRSLELAQLEHWVAPREVDGRLVGEASFCVPADLPLGWHVLIASTPEGISRGTVVVTPRRLPARALAVKERMWGLMVQLYALRSQHSWGMGDTVDARDLATWSSVSLGADFLLLNPMHASTFVPPMEPSPYLPSSRRFMNPIYLRIETINEFAYLTAKARKAIGDLLTELHALPDDRIDRDAIWAAKAEALRVIADIELSVGRQASFDAFVAHLGPGLIDFATWSALACEYGARWTLWPAEYRHPANEAVSEWRMRHADEVRWHLWLQWLMDEQLAQAQSSALRAGMTIGIVHDLAVGVAYDGADAWALQDVLATGVSVGAPPDMYNQLGQNWAQPPWRPDALAEAGFVPYRDMLRTVLRNAGGIRIDHVLGLFRMWWVPEGEPADQGTYVSFDHEALVGILALEVDRVEALVVGEDLGTVEPWVQQVLADRGLLGTSIMWFERDEHGDIIDPNQWRRDVLASVTVHDLPPTAGYLRGEHVRLRHELGVLKGDLVTELDRAEKERADWLTLLAERDLIGRDEADTDHADIDEIVIALHRLIAQTPARLIGVSVPDLVGDVRTQNQPGTHQEYPNWQVPIADVSGNRVWLEDLARFPLTRAVAAAVNPSL